MNKIKELLTEAYRILEQDMMQQQQSAAPMPQQPTGGMNQQPSAPTPDGSIDNTMPEAPPMDNASGATIDSLIEQLNIIRSGKSFGEPSIYKAISDLYAGIDPQKKQAVQEVVKQIADALTQASAAVEMNPMDQSAQTPGQSPPMGTPPQPNGAPPQQQPAPQQPVI